MLQPASSSALKIRKTVGASAVLLGLVLGGLGLSSRTSAAKPVDSTPTDEVETQVVELNNSSAQTGSDCPDSDNYYWHFVATPNNAIHTIQSVTLVIGGTSYTFSGSQIIPNGDQVDNVFVAVPQGSELTDLSKTGSSAVIVSTEGVNNLKFNLSHVCDPSSSTTTTVAPTTTTVEPTTTTVAESTTTIPESTTTTTIVGSGGPTTTTTTIVGSAGPTTTTEPATTSTLVGSQGPTVPVVASLPTTGNSGSTAMLLLAGLSMLVGLVLTVTSRRAA